MRIDAAPEKIFPLIDDFHNWPSWAPQDKDDASMKRTYSGAAFGTGAVSDWASSGSAGKGRMSIIESTPPTRVVVKVDFVKPFAAHNLNEFILESIADGSGDQSHLDHAGLQSLCHEGYEHFVNMDRVMGKHFESGLNNLKKAAENRP